MKRLKINILIFVLVAAFTCSAQQDPHYTQYTYNMNVINPAYSGSKGVLSIGLLGRKQFMGFEGAPQTFTLAVNTPIGDKTGAGIIIIQDKVGDLSETTVTGDFSYTIPAAKAGYFSFGVKAGASLQSIDLASLEANDEGDFLASENISKMYPQFGAGVYFYAKRYYIGLSVPNILKTKHFDETNGAITTASEQAHYYFTSGIVFSKTYKLKFKPSILIKATAGAPVSIDLSGNVMLKNKFEFGLSYRVGDAISAMLGFKISRRMRIGYAYDYTTSALGDYSSGSHEIMINFVNRKSRSPRFF